MTKAEIRHTRKADLAAQISGLYAVIEKQRVEIVKCHQDFGADLRRVRLAVLREVARLPIVAVSPAVRAQIDRFIVAADGDSILPKVEK